MDDRARHALYRFGPWALCAAHILANLSWLIIDTRPPYYDMAGHAIATLHVIDLPFWTDPRVALNAAFHLNQYPPLVYWMAAPVAEVFGRNVDVMTAVNGAFFCVLILSTAGITRRLASPRAALLAAFLVSMYPIVYGLSREFLLDVPLTAMTTLAILLLLRTDYFSRLRASLAFGVVAGLGMLTKWTFVVYIAGPVFVVLVGTLRRASRRQLLNVATLVVIGAAIMAPWYLANISAVDYQFRLNYTIGARPAAELMSSEVWLHYARDVISHQLLAPLAILWAVSIVVLLIRRRDSATALLLAWTAVTYIAMTFYGPKDIRYTMPFLPAGAITSALVLDGIRSTFMRRVLIGATAAWCLIEFTGLTWGLAPLTSDGQFARYVLFENDDLPYYSEAVHIASPAMAQNWHVQEILRKLEGPTRFGPPDGPVKITVIPNAPYFEANVFDYFATAEGQPLQVFFVASGLPLPDVKDHLMNSDYVVAKTGYQGPPYTLQRVEPWAEQLRDPSTELGRTYMLIATYTLPDRSVAELYRHR